MRLRDPIFFLLIAYVVFGFASLKPQTPYHREELHWCRDPWRIVRSCDTNSVFKVVEVFKYDSSFHDSTRIARIYFRNDSVPACIAGAYYYAIPFLSEMEYDMIVAKANGHPKYETYDENVCEAGGRSAWNRYLIAYNKYGQVDSIRHYKAFRCNECDTPPVTKPNYHLAYTYVYTWSKFEDGLTVISNFGGNRNVQDRFKRRFDDAGRIISDEWISYPMTFMRMYFHYR